MLLYHYCNIENGILENRFTAHRIEFVMIYKYRKSVSYIIPCYKSENTIEDVVGEIQRVSESLLDDYEIILINDCSPDNLMIVLKRLSKDKRIKVISFAKNFGQHAGMMAGLNYAQYECAVIMDDDGQCPIDHVSELIQPIFEGYDVVYAGYGKQKQSLIKNICSVIHAAVSNILMDKSKDIQMSNFIALSRVAIDEIKNYRGPYPHISGLIFRSFKRIKNVKMEERKRVYGRTTYNAKKMFELWLNSITAFSVIPVRISAFIGFIFAIAGIVIVIILLVERFVFSNVIEGYFSLMASNLLIGGIILINIAVVGEYVARIYMSVNSAPQYVIGETININSK